MYSYYREKLHDDHLSERIKIGFQPTSNDHANKMAIEISCLCYLIKFGVSGTVNVNGALIFGTFFAGPLSEEQLETVDDVDAIEHVDKVLRRADLLSGTFFSRFLERESILVKLTWYRFQIFLQSCIYT